MEFEQVWQTALGEIEIQISKPNFATWLKNSQLLDKQDGTVLVGLPNTFAKEWVENKYQKIILNALRNHDQTTKKVQFTVHNNNTAPAALAPKKHKQVNEEEFKKQLAFEELKIDPETNLNPRYRLSSFV